MCLPVWEVAEWLFSCREISSVCIKAENRYKHCPYLFYRAQSSLPHELWLPLIPVVDEGDELLVHIPLVFNVEGYEYTEET